MEILLMDLLFLTVIGRIVFYTEVIFGVLIYILTLLDLLRNNRRKNSG